MVKGDNCCVGKEWGTLRENTVGTQVTQAVREASAWAVYTRCLIDAHNLVNMTKGYRGKRTRQDRGKGPKVGQRDQNRKRNPGMRALCRDAEQKPKVKVANVALKQVSWPRG